MRATCGGAVWWPAAPTPPLGRRGGTGTGDPSPRRSPATDAPALCEALHTGLRSRRACVHRSRESAAGASRQLLRHRDPTTARRRLRQQRHPTGRRSEEHTSELQSLMRISYAVFCLKKKIKNSHILLQLDIHSQISIIFYSFIT